MGLVEGQPTVRGRLSREFVELSGRLAAGLVAQGADWGEAEERAQEALVEVFAVADRVESPDALVAFSRTVAERGHWRARRDAQRTVAVAMGGAQSPADVVDEVPGPGWMVERRAVVEVLAVAMSELSVRDRRMLWDRHVEGDSCQVLAERHGLAPGAVPNVLYRARRRLRALLVAAELGE